MAELEPIHEKFAEVLGLAQAAQTATSKVANLAEGERDVEHLLERMHDEAGDTRRRCEQGLSSFEGRKTAIEDKARETRQEAEEMMRTYLGDDADALDGFEFLTMAEAGELGHWEIVQKIVETIGDSRVSELAEWAVGVQRGHFEGVRLAALALAEKEARELAAV